MSKRLFNESEVGTQIISPTGRGVQIKKVKNTHTLGKLATDGTLILGQRRFGTEGREHSPVILSGRGNNWTQVNYITAGREIGGETWQEMGSEKRREVSDQNKTVENNQNTTQT